MLEYIKDTIFAFVISDGKAIQTVGQWNYA